MKIILRPTNPAARHAAPIISITTPGDGLVLSDALEQLIVPALIAYGYHPQAIQDCFRDFEVAGAAQDDATVIDADDYSVPEGFAYIGYGADVGGDNMFDEDDVLYSHDAQSWEETRFVNGGPYHYAVRIFSAPHTIYLSTL